jgi:hypothetical protein
MIGQYFLGPHGYAIGLYVAGLFNLWSTENLSVPVRAMYYRAKPVTVEKLQKILELIQRKISEEPVLTTLINPKRIVWYKANLQISTKDETKFYSKDDVIDSIQKRYKVEINFVEETQYVRGVAYVSFFFFFLWIECVFRAI